MLPIKNIQAYRTYFKKNIRGINDPSRDENLLSPLFIDPKTKGRTFGWFDIYHGDSSGFGNSEEGVRNKLLSFLNMAKDGQAVYEFLQNAVDAESTHFTMIWGSDQDGCDYLMVANNGKMFSNNNVRSILNIGASTKSNDQRSIGKFGIGFKLAHRLVGKGNGLDELINDFSGPILFSWKNGELQALAKSKAVEPSDVCFEPTTAEEQSENHPWLFKILLTCFPCLPENAMVAEFPKLLNGKPTETPLFPKSELVALSRWTKKLISATKGFSYSEGSLFFLRLGQGKGQQLHDKNLEEGVKFSMGILGEINKHKQDGLQGLQTVQLNQGNPIELPKLQYETFLISQDQDEFWAIFPKTEEGEGAEDYPLQIEFLIGFKPYDQIDHFFKGAPNFYLYFPLSEEVHQFNFILHCNSFDNSASRTFLQPGTAGNPGINENLFWALSSQVAQRMEVLAVENPRRFLDLYAAFLSSGQSGNDGHQWISTPWLEPLNRMLKRMIPVRIAFESPAFELCQNPGKTFIKSTGIDIDPTAWGLGDLNWFYWDRREFEGFAFKAENKLGIGRYTIFRLLENKGISQHINTWLADDPKRIKMILDELNVPNPDQESKVLINNILELKILEFTDGSVLSFQDLAIKQSEGYFVLHNTLADIQDILKKIGFMATKYNFNRFSFINTLRNHLTKTSQLRGHTELVKLFSETITAAAAALLSSEEKYAIYKAFRNLNERDRPERMRELKLFKNNNGDLVYLKNLLRETNRPWLQPFAIDPSELQQDMAYFIEKDGHIYTAIVLHFWEDLAKRLVQNTGEAIAILEEITALFEVAENQEQLLSGSRFVFFQGRFEKQERIFFHQDILQYLPGDYQQIQALLCTHFKLSLPDQWFVPFLDQQPFFRESTQLEFRCPEAVLELTDLILLLRLADDVTVPFYQHLFVREQNTQFLISETAGLQNGFTNKQKLIAYIQNYESDQFVLLPPALSEAPQLPEASDSKLVDILITDFPIKSADENQQIFFTEALLSADKELQWKWFKRLPLMVLDANSQPKNGNTVYLQLLSNLFDFLDENQWPELWKKMVVMGRKERISIGSIHQASDTILVQKMEKEYQLSGSKILDRNDQLHLQIIQDFAQKCVAEGPLSTLKADQLFKLNRTEVTQELLLEFHDNLVDLQLTNANQLALVLLCDLIPREEVNSYQVTDRSGAWKNLEGNWYLHDEQTRNYTTSSFSLHSCYQGLRELLQLADVHALPYSDKDGDLILGRFLFQKGCTADALDSEIASLELLIYLYESWKTIPNRLRSNKADENWLSIFDFNPKNLVYHPLRVASEKLPDEVESWLANDPDKTTFMHNLGLQTAASDSIQLRSFLVDELIPFSAEKLPTISNYLLENSLLGLANGFDQDPTSTDSKVFGLDDTRIPIIRDIHQRLAASNAPNFPVFVHLPDQQITLADPENTRISHLDKNLHDLLAVNNQEALNLLYVSENILENNDLLAAYLDEKFNPIPIHEVLETSNAVEHREPFYAEWAEKHEVRLFQNDQLQFQVAAHIESGPIFLGNIQKNGFHFVQPEKEFPQIHYASRALTLDALHDLLETDGNTYSDAISEFIQLRRQLVDIIDKQLVSGGEFNEAFRKHELEKKRKAFVKQLSIELKYSYAWFVAYLGYLDTFKEVKDSTQQQSLMFRLAEKQLVNARWSNKHFYLRDANKLIPESIEHFKDFSLSITYKDKKKERLHLEGVSKKGQDLLVYTGKELPKGFLEKLPELVEASIEFTPVLDLLERLKLSFSNRTYIPEWQFAKDAMPAIRFIYGPPGTGKTTTLAELINKRLQAIREPQAKPPRFLILTPTNKAADVLISKILSEHPEAYAYRLGHPTSPELEAKHPEVYQSSVDMDLLHKADVLATTIHRLPYFKVTQEGDESLLLFRLRDHWDYVIFDEASMITLPYTVFALMALQQAHPNTHFVVAGDPQQIPPVQPVEDNVLEEMGIDEENIYKMLQIDSFDEIEQQRVKRPIDTIDNLSKQFRSVAKIGQLFSEFSYNGLLEHNRVGDEEKARILPKAFQKLLPDPVSFIHFPVEEDDSMLMPQKLVYSSYHLYSAILATEMIFHFDRCLQLEVLDDAPWNIGLISPYKAHAMLTNKLITSYGLSEKIRVYCDTIHGFQGDECDIILFTVTPNNLEFTGHKKSLLVKKYLYNVAISRARDYLWILHPSYQNSKNPMMETLMSIHGEKTKSRPSMLIERELFDKSDFIAKSNYFSGHDAINIYGYTDQNYFIKAGHSAIDIQLRNVNHWSASQPKP